MSTETEINQPRQLSGEAPCLQLARAVERLKADAVDVDPFVSFALAELLEHISDDMSDSGATEWVHPGRLPEHACEVRDEYGKSRFDWMAALKLARTILTVKPRESR